MQETKRHRKIEAALLLSVLFLFFASFAADALEMDLMQGEVRKGTIPLLDQDGIRYAALDEMLASLGFAPSPVTGGLIVTYSGKKIEFWSGSNVARVNGMVYSLPSVVFMQDGHWWGEYNASLQAISQFLAGASRPSNISWAQAGASRAAATTPVAPPRSDRPRTEPLAAPAVPEGMAKIAQVRWGEPGDAYRAVVDVSDEVDVTLKESPGQLEVTFAKTSAPAIDASAPWPGFSVSSAGTSGNTVLTFKHSAKSVKSFWLQGPSRYVIDFYSEGPTPTPLPTAKPEVTTTQQRSPAPSAPVPSPAGNKRQLIVIDAGHGGHDPGAVGNKLKEKDINLKAVGELSASLKKLGYDVKLTRADDRYLKLNERAVIANEANADIFISLHCNALPKGKHASGIELYLMAESTDKDALNLAILENRELSGNAQNAAEVNAAADKRTQLLLKILGDMQQNDKINESTVLAEHIYDRMRGAGLSIRKVRQAPFYVLQGAGMPALLVEMGYITEASDAKLLNSQAHRQKMMDALAAGIQTYLKRGPQGGR